MTKAESFTEDYPFHSLNTNIFSLLKRGPVLRRDRILHRKWYFECAPIIAAVAAITNDEVLAPYSILLYLIDCCNAIRRTSNLPQASSVALMFAGVNDLTSRTVAAVMAWDL